MLPESTLFSETEVTGSSTTLVADTVIPLRRCHASKSCPFTLNLWPGGILNC